MESKRANSLYSPNRPFYSCLLSSVTWPVTGSEAGGDLVLIKF